MQSLSIGNSVTNIFYEAFAGCSGLTSVTIGGSVEKIGDEAFRGCIHLRTINCRAEYPPVCASGTFTDVPRYADVIVPCGAAYRYEASDYWNEFTCITENCNPSGIENIDADNINVRFLDGGVLVKGVREVPLQIYDISGKLRYAYNNISENICYPASDLQAGIYLVKLGALPARKLVVIR